MNTEKYILRDPEHLMSCAWLEKSMRQVGPSPEAIKRFTKSVKLWSTVNRKPPTANQRLAAQKYRRERYANRIMKSNKRFLPLFEKLPEALKAMASSVCAHYGVDVETMMSLCRFEMAVRARGVIFVLAEQVFELTQQRIAALFNRKDHSAVSKAIIATRKRISVDTDESARLEFLKAEANKIKALHNS